MKAMAMVAHPDDCVIFSYSFINHYAKFDWTICYLTYNQDHARGQEFADFWYKRNIQTKFLGFPDDWEYVKNNQLGFDSEAAAMAIQETIKDQNLILTHNYLGDYGHIHHKFINEVVANNHTYVVTFAGPGEGNVKYTVDSNLYTLDEFPLHKDVVSGFHLHTHTNEYCISERVKKIL